MPDVIDFDPLHAQLDLDLMIASNAKIRTEMGLRFAGGLHFRCPACGAEKPMQCTDEKRFLWFRWTRERPLWRSHDERYVLAVLRWGEPTRDPGG